MNPFTWTGRLAWGLTAVWTILVATSLLWNFHQVRQTALKLAGTQAHLSYNKDLVYRLWAAGHGGVYVPVTPQTPPNPYLSHIPERDILTPSGRALTLMNPAYMTRQVHELAAQVYGIKGHLTSLKPIRPENAPDTWETRALNSFEAGTPEITEVVESGGEPHLRFMRPWHTEKSCLKCHAAQGYKEGDIRGGISLDIPMKPFLAGISSQTYPLAAGHGLIWVLGLGGIIMGNRHIRRYLEERRWAEEKLQRAHDELEGRVKERTAYLKQAMEALELEMAERLDAEAKLQESEARFRSAFDQSPVGAAIVDLGFRFQRVNHAFCRISGYSAQELYSMAVPDLVHPDDLPKGLETMKLFISGEIDRVRLEERNIRKDGAVIWVDANADLIRDAEARPIYYIGIIQDITARKQAEEALRESEERLSFLSKQLIATQEIERQHLGWELHEDLGPLLALLKLQLRAVYKNLPSDPVETRRTVENIFSFIDELIERLRHLSRNLRPEILEDLGLNVALESLFKDFQKHSGLKLTMNLDNIKDLFPRQAQLVIYRIFQDALTNVAKHSKATKVSVSIKSEDGRVVFQMEDNGCGFELQQILGGDYANRGLGLVAIDERVRMLGGDLQLWSQPGQGTRLHFTVPAAKPKL